MKNHRPYHDFSLKNPTLLAFLGASGEQFGTRIVPIVSGRSPEESNVPHNRHEDTKYGRTMSQRASSGSVLGHIVSLSVMWVLAYGRARK